MYYDCYLKRLIRETHNLADSPDGSHYLITWIFRVCVAPWQLALNTGSNCSKSRPWTEIAGKQRERGGSDADYREPSRGDSINYNYTIRSRFGRAEPRWSGRELDMTIRYRSSIAGQRAFIVRWRACMQGKYIEREKLMFWLICLPWQLF
jgi:hypothetical protein